MKKIILGAGLLGVLAACTVLVILLIGRNPDESGSAHDPEFCEKHQLGFHDLIILCGRAGRSMSRDW